MNRPLGIKILGWFEIIGVLVFWTWLFLRAKHFFTVTPQFFYFATYSLLIFSTAIGLLLLKNWARILTIAFVAIKTITGSISSITDAYTLYTKSPMSKSGALLVGLILIVAFLGIGTGIIYYLTRPKVKKQFQKE